MGSDNEDFDDWQPHSTYRSYCTVCQVVVIIFCGWLRVEDEIKYGGPKKMNENH